jgi:hypothetical protein
MHKTTVLILFLLITFVAFPQQIKVTRDCGIWGGFNVEKKLSKDVEINLEQQLRFYSNATKLDDYIIDFGGKYTLNKNFRLGANVRYIYDAKRWKDAENNFRYNFDLHYNGNISAKLKLFYRVRYQKEFVELFADHLTPYDYYSGIRHKLKMRYNLNKKNKLFISGELFRLMETFKTPFYNKLRFEFGNEMKTGIGIFNFAFGYEQEINTNYPLSFFYLKTIYTLKL